MDIKQMALSMLSQNPNVANNPVAQEAINAIKTGDNEKGEQLARNLCASMGVKPEDVYNQAKGMFNIL